MKESRSSRAARTAGKAAKLVHPHPLVSCRISVFWEGENKYFRVRHGFPVSAFTCATGGVLTCSTVPMLLPSKICNILPSRYSSSPAFSTVRAVTNTQSMPMGLWLHLRLVSSMVMTGDTC